MPSYQEFAAKARERFQEKKNEKKETKKSLILTRHAEYKMKQYGLSLQKVRGVIRHPKRTETGIAKNTIAVMQPVSPKKEADTKKEIWKQEIWVMYQTNKQEPKQDSKNRSQKILLSSRLQIPSYKIISAWRYPGMSPKRSPIPEDILLELADELC